MNKKKHIHFVGIKGVGVAPLAIIAKEAGFGVSGCDVEQEFITDKSLKKAGIKPLVGFSSDHLKGVDMLITTGAHGGFDNAEVIAARNLGIAVMTQGEAVGYFMEGKFLGKKYEGVSVLGTHGKTTTTAMIATILEVNNFDPSYVVGTSDIVSIGLPGHFGRGKYFVAEADEYATEPTHDKTPKFMWQHSKVALVTNIEFDHPDVYEDAQAFQNAVLKYLQSLSADSTVVGCGDDAGVREVFKKFDGKKITYGFSKECNIFIERLSISGDHLFFWISAHDTSLGEFSLPIFGQHNALNAAGALAVCLELGLSPEQIKKGLAAFKGSKRRMEFIGLLPGGAQVYDDYAHHPTEIKKTLSSFAKSFPTEKITVIFQPHMYSRTKALFNEFASAFGDADTVILTDIYPSLREEPDPSVSSELLASAMKQKGRKVVFLPKLADVVEYLKQNSFGHHDIVITMGAGDVYKISSKLKVQSSKV